MTWYFNFCAPTIPNDSMINFHRKFQSAQLMTLMIIFVLYHTYYKIWGPDPLSQTADQSENQSKNESQSAQSYQNGSQQKSQNDQSKSDHDENKSVSIAQKLKDIGRENESYISFKGSGQKFLRKRNFKQTSTVKGVQNLNIKVNVTVQEIQSFFPIVFGHHAIAMGASIMYSPYAEQSIAAILYVLFSFFLAIFNSKRMKKCTYAVWMIMAFLNVFILMSALLQVGQSNWDSVNNMCFAQQYTPLY